jgi:hypothetical protein
MGKAAGCSDVGEVQPPSGMARLHSRLAEMPVVDHDDDEIARFCDGDRGEAAERHQLFAVAGDDKNSLFRLRLRQPQTDKSGSAVPRGLLHRLDLLLHWLERGSEHGGRQLGNSLAVADSSFNPLLDQIQLSDLINESAGGCAPAVELKQAKSVSTVERRRFHATSRPAPRLPYGWLIFRTSDEDHEEKNERRDAKRRLLAVPALRLPHRVPFSADRGKSDEPDEKSSSRPSIDETLGPTKVIRAGIPRAQKLNRSAREEGGGQRLPRNDRPESDQPDQRDREGVVRHRAGRNRVHAEHMPHKCEILTGIMDVSVRDQAAQNRHSATHDDFEDPFHHHFLLSNPNDHAVAINQWSSKPEIPGESPRQLSGPPA